MAKKVLIVDDDPLMTKLYTDTLTPEGFEIDTAANGEQGLLKARENVPNIILLDIMMPHTNGLEVLDKLRIDPLTKKIPIIVLTNNPNEGDEKYAYEKGAVKYISKVKLDPRELLYLVKKTA